jgi:hypothetical protein
MMKNEPSLHQKFKYILGALSTQRMGGGDDINMKHTYERYELQFEVLGSSEVIGHKLGLQCP